MPGVTLAEVGNGLMAADWVQRVLVLTERRTGNAAIRALDMSRAEALTSIAYTAGGGGSAPGLDVDDALTLAAASAPQRGYDLIVLDPFHTYASSFACIAGCLDLLQPDGVLAVHDCLPPPTWTRPEPVFTDTGWCGVTFAAMRDVCRSRGIAWFTIDADFGVGLASPHPSPDGPDGEDRRAWTAGTHDDYVAGYSADPYLFMRAVAAADGWEALRRLRERQPVGDLLASFPGWHTTEREAREAADPTITEREFLAAMISGLGDELVSERERQPSWAELGYLAARKVGLR